MTDIPPSSVSIYGQEDDNGSELTGPLYSDDDLSLTDDFGIKLAADTYYYHTLDGQHAPAAERRELLELRMQIIRQQEKLDILSSKLSQSGDENEALRAEKKVLVNELHAIQEKSISTPSCCFSNTDNDGESMLTSAPTNAKLMADNSRLQVVTNVLRKSFQSHIKESRIKCDKDKKTIETLQREIELLKQRTSVPQDLKLPLDALAPSRAKQADSLPKKSFSKNERTSKTSTHSSRRSLSERTEEALPSHQDLKLPLESMVSTCTKLARKSFSKNEPTSKTSTHCCRCSFEHSLGECTAETLPSDLSESIQLIDSSQHSTQDSMQRTLNSIPELEFNFGVSGDVLFSEDEDIEATDNSFAVENDIFEKISTRLTMSKETKDPACRSPRRICLLILEKQRLEDPQLQ